MALSAAAQRRLVLLLAAASLACAPASREGELVGIHSESAIIVWDAAAKTQHFIRRADFRTRARDFGFLVPTPSEPKLEEASEEAFALLAKVTAPATRWEIEWPEFGDRPMPKKAAAKEAAKAPPVVVLAEERVAGYDAAVLHATDARALDGWLKKHGYHSSPELVEWFGYYIERKWIITAFKIAKGAEADRATAHAIRMTFAADRPFFPYREPKSAEEQDEYQRPLRVFLIADQRYAGAIADGKPWGGDTVWSGPLEGQRNELFKQLALSAPPASANFHLTEFIDRFSHRQGRDDLFFSASPDQAQVRRPDIVYKISLLELAILVGIAALVLWVFRLILRSLWRRWSKRETS